MVLKKYNNVLTSGRWFNKYPKDSKILDLFVVAQKLADDSKVSSEKSNRESKKGFRPTSITPHPGCCKIQKREWESKPRTKNNIGGTSNTALVKANGSTTRQNITGSVPVPHQSVDEALIQQARGTATRI